MIDSNEMNRTTKGKRSLPPPSVGGRGCIKYISIIKALLISKLKNPIFAYA